MGRNRVISEDKVLDAAQHVVAKNGASQLTIEAVAIQAGISKASVLYLYKSKRGLIKAVVDRMVTVDAAVNEAAIKDLEGDQNAAIRGRLRASSKGVTNDLRSIGLNLCASIANDQQLRRSGKDYMQRTVQRIKATCDHPKGAMLAFLALEGVKLLELVDWHTWTEGERKRLLQDIECLIDIDPRPSGPATKSISRRPSEARPSQRQPRKLSSRVATTGTKARYAKKSRVPADIRPQLASNSNRPGHPPK